MNVFYFIEMIFHFLAVRGKKNLKKKKKKKKKNHKTSQCDYIYRSQETVKHRQETMFVCKELIHSILVCKRRNQEATINIRIHVARLKQREGDDQFEWIRISNNPINFRFFFYSVGLGMHLGPSTVAIFTYLDIRLELVRFCFILLALTSFYTLFCVFLF